MNAYRDQYATLFRGGRNVTLLAVSVDPIDQLASWAHDSQFPFQFLSDLKGEVGRAYGAFQPAFRLDNRSLYVIGPDGRVAHVMAPFREIDPQAYTELKEAIDRVTP